MRYVLLLAVTLTMSGCGRTLDPAEDATSRLNSQPKAPDIVPSDNNHKRIGWQASDIAGNKLHLISEPNQIGLFRFDAGGTVAARVSDLGMVEMFWKIDTDGKLQICDDNDFGVLHSWLRLDAWEGDKALVYNEIKNRKEEYFREFPQPLDVEELLTDGNAEQSHATEPEKSGRTINSESTPAGR